MFSATKFVVASAIVALFGGFLLAGALTQQGDESVPAVGASASVEAETTVEATAAVESAEPETSINSDLLPGVDLMTEEVEPGIFRVHEDGTGRSMELVQRITVEDDGTSWMVRPGGIYESGQAERHPGSRRYGYGFLALAGDGTLWAAWEGGSNSCDDDRPISIRSFDGEAWAQRNVDRRASATGPDPRWPPDAFRDFAVHPDGTAWATGGVCGGDDHTSLQHLGPDGWMIYDIGDGLPNLPCEACGEEWTIEITPDGTVWVGIENGGLLRFDGTEWEVVRPLGGDEDHGVVGLAANRNGVLWAEIQVSDRPWERARLGEGRHLARFDGTDWSVFEGSPMSDVSYGPDSDYLGPSGIQAVGPEGEVWLTDQHPDVGRRLRLKDLREMQIDAGHFPVSFDGETWDRYPEIQAHWQSDPSHDPRMVWEEAGQWRIEVAPDGTAWVNRDAAVGHRTRGGVYAITPEAIGAAE